MNTDEESTFVYYDPRIDGERMIPQVLPLECSEMECNKLATHRDSEGYPWCDDHK